ncbi:MAG: hypothetical protein ABIE03_03705 [Patescibacteria group bacterium]|nr:hypothetical protein [Patescibacteria group bacterium]
MKYRNLLGVFFKDKNGKVVIGQFPNISLIGGFVFMVLTQIKTSEQIHSVFSFMSSAFLFTWSYLELTQGVNYFRRMLGVAGLTLVILNNV